MLNSKDYKNIIICLTDFINPLATINILLDEIYLKSDADVYSEIYEDIIQKLLEIKNQ